MSPAFSDDRCAECGAPIDPLWRHCGACGTRADPAGSLEVDERVVTVVVSDLQGSTAIAERLDPESVRAALDRYFDDLGSVMERHGGRIEKRIGDMMVTVFGAAGVAADDAASALSAVHAARRTLDELNDELDARWGVRLVNRTGVATGRITYRTAAGTHRLISGEVLEAASALEPLAPSSGALVDLSTMSAVADVDAAEFGAVVEHVDKGGATHRAAELLDATLLELSGAGAESTCGSCGTPWEPDTSWCVQCGTLLDAARRRGDSRRHVTIVFIDLVVNPSEHRDPDGDAALVLELFDLARDALEQHGGIVERFIGDAVMAVFGLDRRHEDDALRAARAALEVHQRIAAHAPGNSGVDVEVRIGVNTGPVIAGDPEAGERLVTGDTVNVAARLEQTAWPGAVVIGELTHRLIGQQADVVPLAPLSLKGKSQPVAAWRLVSLGGGTRGASGSIELPFVGRADEVAALRSTWESCRRDRKWRRVDLVGPAGVGKSRLLHEVLDLVAGETLVARGSCPSYGEGITFLPVIELIRDATAITQDADADVAVAALRAAAPDGEVASLLADLLGVTDGNPPLAELFWAVRSFFSHLGAARPLVLVLDGLHSIQPTLVELLDEMLELGGDQPVMVVTMAREAPDGADHPHRARLDLAPLSRQSTNDLLSFTLGHGVLDTRTRDRLTHASEGLPLFVEQLLRSLVDQGVLRRDGQGWVASGDLAGIEVPPSVEAMLAARIDALPVPERSVVDTASVIGREFGATAVGVLLDAGVDAELSELERRQFVAPSPAPDRLGDHRFRSPMTRDVAYGSLLKRERAQLHRAYGDWLLGAARLEGRREMDELVGYHLERSFHLAGEVGTLDDELTSVGRRAAMHLGDSGRRAFVRGDMPAAANLLGRAAATLPCDPRDAAELLVLAGEASFEQGAFEEALGRYDRAEELAGEADELGLGTLARVARITQRYLTGDGVEGDEAMREAVAAQQVLEQLGEDAALARATRLRAYVDMTVCQWGAAEAAARETLATARRAGDIALERRVLPALSSFALYGPTPVPEARARCEELLAAVDGDRRARCLIERSLAHLMAMDGESAEAVALCSATRVRLQELGWNFDAALVSLDLGPIHLLAGDARSAERELRLDHDTLSEMGEQNYLATISSLLADAVRRQDRHEEALDLVAEAEALASEEDISASAGWRLVRARVLLDQGDAAGALPWALAAQELLGTTDELTSQAECLVDLAQIRSALGDEDAARAHLADATARFEAKGHRVGVQRCEALTERARAGP